MISSANYTKNLGKFLFKYLERFRSYLVHRITMTVTL